MLSAQQLNPALSYRYEWLILLLARLSIAGIFWQSAQTKIDGFQFDLINGVFLWGIPHIKESTFFLFEYEYALPIISPTLAAYMATTAELLLSLALVFGVMTRVAGLMLCIMILVIEWVYPLAFITHLSWMSLTLLIAMRGAGPLSLDCWLRRYFP